MSFYIPPEINLQINGRARDGLTMLLPYYCYKEEFYKMGIRYLSPKPDEPYATARLPRNWTVSVISTREGKKVSLFYAEGCLKAKVMYGLFVDVDFST